MEEKLNKIEALANDEKFIDQMKKASSKEDLQRVFAEFGVDLTREEIDAIAEAIEKMMSDELNENDLENAAGGVSALAILGWAWKGAKAIAKPCFKAGVRFTNWLSKYY